MRQGFVLLVVLVSVLGVVKAEPVEGQKELGVTFDFTYTSKWLSKGVEAYGSNGGLFETLDFDFYGTGFGLKVTHRHPTGNGNVDKQRFDYRPYYKGSLFEDETYKTNYSISVGYEHYYGLNRTAGNTTWEWIFAFAWPELLGNGFVPKYVAHYEVPARTLPAGTTVTGWVHRFILDYGFDVESLPNPVKLSSEIGYYDGLGGKTSDWAYTTFGLSTKFNVNENVVLVPGVYYQRTLDSSLNPGKDNDIFYTMVSMKYAF